MSMNQVVNANDVIGVSAENVQGDNLGKVEALMLDKLSGKVNYVVLSYGGFLGMGNKLFAMPWAIFSYDKNKDCFQIPLSADQLKNSPGFDKDNWPNMSDKVWGDSISRYYNTSMTDSTAHDITDTNGHIVNANDVIGVSVENMQGDDLGKVEALMLDKLSGKVSYVVLSYGGFLGMGNKLFAMPWSIFSYNKDKDCFQISLNEEQLKNSPGFNKDNWPNMSDKTWSDSISHYYNTSMNDDIDGRR